MSTIELVILGLIKEYPQSAYDIQKEVERRHLSKWVKISIPSIYKKALQLEEKGYITSTITREGKMPEKTIYSLTESGEVHFLQLMGHISEKPVNIFLDFNSVIMNFNNITQQQRLDFLEKIEKNIIQLKYEALIQLKDTSLTDLEKSILSQQLGLIETLEQWVYSLH